MMRKFDKSLMKTAELWANQSTCKRLQVGCVISKDSRIISIGFNGTISGASNVCEENDKTKEDVIHAEMNALMFATKHGISTDGTTIYCTHAPCINCAKHIIQCGINRLVYLHEYHSTDGLKLLQKFIKVDKYEE